MIGVPTGVEGDSAGVKSDCPRQTAKPLRVGRERAIAPVVGAGLLVGIVVVLAATVAVGFGSLSVGSLAPMVAFDLSVDADRSEVVLERVAGDSIDAADLSVTVLVDDQPLEHQPPVPFVGAPGFQDAPGGPFNAKRDDTEWRTGERASFRVASTNDPTVDPGDEVTVTLAIEGETVARLGATAA